MASIEFINKRIEGKEKEITKLTKKLERIAKAKATNWEVNPYYYREDDERYAERDLAAAVKALEDYKAQLAEEEAKAAEERRKAYEAQKAVSQYQGEVGDKIKIEIVESHTGHYETRFGFTTKYMNVHIMKDAAGNVYTWHTECGLGYETEKGNYESWHGIEEGERFTLAGTIKAHNEYKGEKQTVMTRCKISQ